MKLLFLQSIAFSALLLVSCDNKSFGTKSASKGEDAKKAPVIIDCRAMSKEDCDAKAKTVPGPRTDVDCNGKTQAECQDIVNKTYNDKKDGGGSIVVNGSDKPGPTIDNGTGPLTPTTPPTGGTPPPLDGGGGTLIDVDVTFRSLGTADAVLKNCLVVSINSNPPVELGCNKGEVGGLRTTKIKLQAKPAVNNLKLIMSSTDLKTGVTTQSISPDFGNVFANVCSYLNHRKGMALQYDGTLLRACTNDNNDDDYQDFNWTLDGLNQVLFVIQGTTLKN